MLGAVCTAAGRTWFLNFSFPFLFPSPLTSFHFLSHNLFSSLLCHYLSFIFTHLSNISFSLSSSSDDWNWVFPGFECVWATRDKTSRSGLESATRAAQTQPAGQDLQEACEWRHTHTHNEHTNLTHTNKNKSVFLFLCCSTQRCLFPTDVCSLPV